MSKPCFTVRFSGDLSNIVADVVNSMRDNQTFHGAEVTAVSHDDKFADRELLGLVLEAIDCEGYFDEVFYNSPELKEKIKKAGFDMEY
jgi:hypothetical protein